MKHVACKFAMACTSLRTWKTRELQRHICRQTTLLTHKDIRKSKPASRLFSLLCLSASCSFKPCLKSKTPTCKCIHQDIASLPQNIITLMLLSPLSFGFADPYKESTPHWYQKIAWGAKFIELGYRPLFFETGKYTDLRPLVSILVQSSPQGGGGAAQPLPPTSSRGCLDLRDMKPQIKLHPEAPSLHKVHFAKRHKIRSGTECQAMKILSSCGSWETKHMDNILKLVNCSLLA